MTTASPPGRRAERAVDGGAAAVARPPLGRDRIVRAAVRLVERDGARALSMRAVAAELGVAVMSLYNHIPNKAALLEGIAEFVMAGMDPHDGAAPPVPGEDWRCGARRLIRAFRRTAHDHPRCMALVLTNKVDFPAGLRAVERALTLCDAAGFDGAASVRAMRTLMAYALGAQLRETGAVRMLDYMPADPAAALARVDPVEFPHVVALAGELTRHDPEADFEFGLDLLLTSLNGLPRRGAAGG
ncbi:TetR/AcrR family transcriptional regulator [Thermomonospora umbrina]|uniref:TetR family transcriptional regulator n=1 Tax=Thermomonospora umbrina TaxID=111806 RepID=A0A3D9SZ67_9ACTN|nr:TetR/AcrR family transcriptional regulator C-terminal domain-containing protein [Thermomonospora umbrina]REF00878.1 TetR family transcriptional regulator [Thermomonospora umbrina]